MRAPAQRAVQTCLTATRYRTDRLPGTVARRIGATPNGGIALRVVDDLGVGADVLPHWRRHVIVSIAWVRGARCVDQWLGCGFLGRCRCTSGGGPRSHFGQ